MSAGSVAWIGFAGSIIGGIIGAIVTIIVMKLTFKYSTKEKEKQNRQEVLPYIDVQVKDITDLKEMGQLLTSALSSLKGTLVLKEDENQEVLVTGLQDDERNKLKKVINDQLSGKSFAIANFMTTKLLDSNVNDRFLSSPKLKLFIIKNIGLETAINVKIVVGNEIITSQLHLDVGADVTVALIEYFIPMKDISFPFMICYTDLYENKYEKIIYYTLLV